MDQTLTIPLPATPKLVDRKELTSCDCKRHNGTLHTEQASDGGAQAASLAQHFQVSEAGPL